MYFVFLEFVDQRVESTLRALRDALQPWKKSNSPIHITVRGPYRSEPDFDYLTELERGFSGQGVRIMGAGYFANEDTFSVFLRAESAVFKDIWWKPDFPTPIAEIQPHITMFESGDRNEALRALNFLRAARISITTTSVRLSVYSSGQKDLFGTRPVPTSPRKVQIKRDIVAIDEEVITRAAELGAQFAAERTARREPPG